MTETDVWNACNALLLEGARPTIERVRQKIGSGSPNTVSPFLDTWFRHLGGRIKDPGAFSAPSNVPDPVQQAARHFWEVALAETRRDFDQRLSDGMAAALSNVEAEKERADQCAKSAFEATTKLSHLHTQYAELADEHAAARDTARVAQATLGTDLAHAQLHIADLERRLERSEAANQSERMEHAAALAGAQARADAATRRAALEIEKERQARAATDKRATAMRSKLDSLQTELTDTVARGAKVLDDACSDMRVAKHKSTRMFELRVPDQHRNGNPSS